MIREWLLGPLASDELVWRAEEGEPDLSVYARAKSTPLFPSNMDTHIQKNISFLHPHLMRVPSGWTEPSGGGVGRGKPGTMISPGMLVAQYSPQ